MSKRTVQYEEAMLFANSIKADYIEVSSKSNRNIDEIL